MVEVVPTIRRVELPQRLFRVVVGRVVEVVETSDIHFEILRGTVARRRL